MERMTPKTEKLEQAELLSPHPEKNLPQPTRMITQLVKLKRQIEEKKGKRKGREEMEMGKKLRRSENKRNKIWHG